MKRYLRVMLFLCFLAFISACTSPSRSPAEEISDPAIVPPNEKISAPPNSKPLPVILPPSCKPLSGSTTNFEFLKLVSLNDGWQIQSGNLQEKEVAIQSLTLTFPTREVPSTATAKIKTPTNEVECWRKIEGGRFEGCTSVVNYQIKGNEGFSLLFQNIDLAKEIPSWRVHIGYKRNEPPTQSKDLKGNQITYFPTYEYEVECG